MRRVIWLAAFALLTCAMVSQSSPDAKTGNFAFVNGQWFDGNHFIKATFYSVNGLLTKRKPAHLDQTFDLSGKFIVPPFGEAHNHNVTGSNSRLDAILRTYLEQGIFYVKIPNNLPRDTAPLKGKVNVPAAPDVSFSGGGLTGAGGHPIEIAENIIREGTWTSADGEGGFYFVVDSLQDLTEKWEKIQAARPDFIKTYLMYSEEYAKRKADPAYAGQRGLDPRLLSEIVARAHSAGLPVSTHVETVADFRIALAAGVDEINHMPGYAVRRVHPSATYELTEQDARLAAKKRVVVVTTLSGVARLDPRGPQAEQRRAADDLHRKNLRLLHEHGVRIAIGSDNFMQTAALEAQYLNDLKVFDTKTLLKLWCETTAAAIFPKRKIGRLREGYEATFLVLAGNPLEDWGATKKIETRVKQGNVLTLP